MTTPDPAALEAAIRANDGSKVRELLRDATEADRRSCAKALRGLLNGPGFPMQEPTVFGRLAEGMSIIFDKMAGVPEERTPAESVYDQWHQMSQSLAFVAAAVGLAGGVGVAARVLDEYYPGWDFPEDGHDLIAGILADRNPEWLADLTARRLAGRIWNGVPAWPLARRLVRLGVIEPPDIPEYTIRMLTTGITFHGQSLLDALRADPGLLDDEIWRLFTVPGASAVLKWDEEWANALTTLAERSLLDRDRLLDACLDAFVRDFPANHMGWYVKFHDRLAPTGDEIAERSAKYLTLLAATSKAGVTLAQRACAMLLDANRLDIPGFLTASAPALVFPQKSAATAQLKLIAKIATRDPANRDQALVAAAGAFAHVREDVQQAALKLLAKHGLPADTAARASIIARAASISPVLAPEAAALGLTLPASSDVTSLLVSPASPPAAPATPEQIPPVTDPAELVQLFARLIEDASDAIAVERAVAGAVRLASTPVAERSRIAAPLLKRAAEQSAEDWGGPFSGRVIRADIARLSQAWATGAMPPTQPRDDMWSGSEIEPEVTRKGTARTMAGILTARIRRACKVVTSGKPEMLLAEPEFADGTISHAALLDRLARSRGAAHSPHDLGVALLRLAPSADDGFWAEWARLDRKSAAAARTAYEEAAAQLDFDAEADGPDLPRVAARLAHPVQASDDPASHCWQLLTDLVNPLLAEHGRRGLANRRGYLVRWDEVVAAWPLLAPHHAELIAAHLLRPLSDGLEPGRSAATIAVDSLAPAGRPFGKIGHLALVTGLASAEPDTRITAATTWTRVAQDGRLTPALAADAITLGVKNYAFKLNRLAESLQQPALDPVAAATVAHTTLLATADLLPAKPAGLHLFLELATRAVATASTAQGALGALTIPSPVTALAASHARTKLAECARLLVQLT